VASPSLPPRLTPFVRHFEDGVAVFDPVTWQTHIVASEGFELLADMITLAGDCNGQPGLVIDRITDGLEAGADHSQLNHWAELACHLAAVPAPARAD
jgi:hypothetical protein